MRSARGLLAASAFLLLLPSTVLNSMLFDIAGEITVHFVAAVGFALLAWSVFDFGTRRWMTWAGAVAAGVSAGTYLLQGVSNLLSATRHSSTLPIYCLVKASKVP